MSDHVEGGSSKSVAAIVALVLAVIAVLTSAMPIINNASFVFATVALVLAIVGLVGISHGKRSGKGIAIAGFALSVLAIVVVLVSQSLYGAALDSAMNGPQVQSATTSSAVQ